MTNSEKKINKKQYNISGMHCVSCVLRIENNLKGLPGVKNVDVNLNDQKAMVEYEQGECDDQKIIKAVEESGYEASLA